MAEKKLSKKALNSGFHRWYYGNLTCFSQEHMQTFGYLCSMLPLCKELYADDPDKMAESMDTYRTFFNTEPQLGTIIVGVTAGLYRDPDPSWYRNGYVRRRITHGCYFLHHYLEPVRVLRNALPVLQGL